MTTRVNDKLKLDKLKLSEGKCCFTAWRFRFICCRRSAPFYEPRSIA